MDNDNASEVPFDVRTPVTEAGAVVGRLAGFWDELCEKVEGSPKSDFIEEIFGRIWDDEDTGDQLASELDRWGDQPEEMQGFGILQACLISCAYAAQAMKAPKNSPDAWKYACSSKYWLGITIGAWSVRKDQDLAVSDALRQRAKSAAAVRHMENHAMKHQVLEWYEANRDRFPSKDKAAEAIAGKVVPLGFRTVRDYLSQFPVRRSED